MPVSWRPTGNLFNNRLWLKPFALELSDMDEPGKKPNESKQDQPKTVSQNPPVEKRSGRDRRKGVDRRSGFDRRRNLNQKATERKNLTRE